LSSRIIPGNEKQIRRMINNFCRLGAEVLHEENAAVHASGHANEEELRQILRVVNPKFFVPVHGEYSYLKRHAELAEESGVEKAMVIENGDVLEIFPDSMEKIKHENLNYFYVDDPVIADAEEIKLAERKKCAWNGVVAVFVRVARSRKGLISSIKLSSCATYTDSGKIILEAEEALKAEMSRFTSDTLNSTIKETAEAVIRSFFKKRIQKNPVILSFIE
jgi:ribonuclease J